MSKAFIPQFPAAVQAPRRFVGDVLSPGLPDRQVQPVEWPQVLTEQEEKILRQAREKALEMEKEAYQKGFAQGEKDGLEMGQKRLEAVLDSCRLLLSQMSLLHQDLYQRYEREMVETVFALVRKILRSDWLLPEGAIQETLKAAFSQAPDARKVVVRLHPRDHQYLLARPESLPPGSGGQDPGRLQLLPDPSVARGGCLLETPCGEIDATLESQLDLILSRVGARFSPPLSPPERPRP